MDAEGEQVCISGFSPGGMNGLWIVGDIFLREYYTIYEKANGENPDRVGFAKSIRI
jgi:hypothetical protein